MSTSYLEGLEWMISGRAVQPVAASRSSGIRPDELLFGLRMNGWQCPDLEAHLATLRNLPAGFPYYGEDMGDGTFRFTRCDRVLDDVASAIERAAVTVGRDLAYWWPSRGDNDVPEATPLAHLAAEFRAADHRVYSNVQFDGGDIAKKLDLLAIHPGNGVIIGVEGKRLYGPSKALSMVADFKRMRAARFDAEFGSPEPQDMRRVGVLLATSWTGHNKIIERWWTGPSRTRAPTTHQGWSSLATILGEAYRVGSAVTHTRDRGWGTHHILWAVGDLSHWMANREV